MALVGTWAFQSCSGPDQTDDTPVANTDQIISLTVSNSNGPATRAGRPLLSSAADQSIENVVVYVVNAADNSIVATKTFSDWQKNRPTIGSMMAVMRSFCLTTSLRMGITGFLPWATTTAAITEISRPSLSRVTRSRRMPF